MISYFFIRLFSFLLQIAPLSWIRYLGKQLGTLLYYLVPHYRKRALSNLSLAKRLLLSSQQQKEIAKQACQNLAIVSLEYGYFSRRKKTLLSLHCKNPEIAQKLHDEKKGIIFFCGHLANWETLFLDGTSRMKGMAIGKPIKNHRLYRWIVSIREQWGGKIIAPKEAIKEGLRALKKGTFLGIVGDQAMPSSNYSYPFLGRKAFNSTAPALLAYKTNSPIFVALVERSKKGYDISYSDPIWPNLQAPLEEEVPRMMDQALFLLEEKILKKPGEWLWQHNRWKQQTPKNVYKPFRHDSLLVILPQDPSDYLPHLQTFRTIYPLDFLILYAPLSCKNEPLDFFDSIFFYERIEETLLQDQRPKIVFNLSGYSPLKSHFLKQSAFKVLTPSDLFQLSKPYLPTLLENDFSAILTRALCRPNTLW